LSSGNERREIMVLLAVIPGILLFLVVWKFDTVEKESPALLARLFAFGALSILAAILLRTLGVHAFTPVFKGNRNLWFVLVDSFILTALIEEGAKYLILKLVTWKNKDFNYTFDAIVYAVTVSVGFVCAENIVYLIKYRSAVEPVKLLLPVFAQIIISIFMGYYYGLPSTMKALEMIRERRCILRRASWFLIYSTECLNSALVRT
jgi:RsiW-degrading membrane proteinase PrsW (M82 family)